MRTPWLRKVRREWAALTGGPVSFSWWLLRAAGRVVFSVAIFGIMGLLYYNPVALDGVIAGTTSPLPLVVWALTTPTFLGFLALVAVLAVLLPFLPDRDPHQM